MILVGKVLLLTTRPRALLWYLEGCKVSISIYEEIY